jgi:hypothetical protein
MLASQRCCPRRRQLLRALTAARAGGSKVLSDNKGAVRCRLGVP